MNKTLVFFKTTPEIEKRAKEIATRVGADLEPDSNEGFSRNHKYKLIIPIGGDGTILHAENKYPGIPKLPLGCGRVEFLSSAPLKLWKKVLKEWQTDNYYLEERTKIICNSKYQALNEINITKTNPGTMVEAVVLINNKELMTIRGDGIIIATPTGSTAYALSAGGSIIDPQSNVITIVPVAPFMGISKPVVISDQNQLKIKLLNKSVLIVDGVKEQEYAANFEFTIVKAPLSTKFIRFYDQPSFYQKIPQHKEW